jgi:rod shape-determining protein MreD
MVNKQRLQWQIMLSLLFAFLLSIFPVPDSLVWARPQWVSLVLVYWILELPERIGMGAAFVAGLCLDGLEGTVFGQHALALCLLAYLVLILYQRLRMFTIWQQIGVIFVIIGLEQLLYHWTQTLAGRPAPSLLILVSCFVSALMWPPLVLFMRTMRNNGGT